MPYIFFPELNHHFTNYWKTYGEITTNNVPIESFEGSYPNDSISENSIFELLFSNAFSGDSYNYMFIPYSFLSLNRSIRERLKFKAGSVVPYVSSDIGTNDLLNISDETIELLDNLLQYRSTGSTDISGIDYDQLTETLSKLIYIYLDLVTNMSYEKLNDTSMISDSSDVLSSLFEFYVLNEAHKLVKSWSTVLENITVDTIFKRWISDLTVDEEVLKKIFVPFVPYINQYTYVYLDGRKLESTQYEISITDEGFYVSWENTGEEFKDGSRMIVEYYVESGD
jgi:hypothetical protein